MEPESASEDFLFLLSGWWWYIFLSSQVWGRAKQTAKASCGETVVQKGVFGESVSSLPA